MLQTVHLPTDNKGLTVLACIIAQQFRGKLLSRARQSIGSVLLLDFGDLLNSKSGKRKRQFGEWHLLIEMASWRILKDGKDLLSSDDTTKKIRAEVGQFEGGTVEKLVIRRNGNIHLLFENGVIIGVTKIYDRNHNHNWSIFYRDCWSLSNADRADQFVFECGTS